MQTALELILEEFGEAREKFDHYMANPDEVMAALKVGAEKARPIAAATLGRVRTSWDSKPLILRHH